MGWVPPLYVGVPCFQLNYIKICTKQQLYILEFPREVKQIRTSNLQDLWLQTKKPNTFKY